MLTKKLEIGLIKAITQLQFARRYFKIIENLAQMSTGTRRGEHCVAGVHENLNALDDFASQLPSFRTVCPKDLTGQFSSTGHLIREMIHTITKEEYLLETFQIQKKPQLIFHLLQMIYITYQFFHFTAFCKNKNLQES